MSSNKLNGRLIGFPPPLIVGIGRRMFLDPTPAELQASLQSATQSLNELKSKNTELETKNKELGGKVDEFRNNNISLMNKVKEWDEKFKGVDVEALMKTMNAQRNDEDKKLLTEGKFEELFERRVKPLKNDHEKQIEAMSTKAKTLEQQGMKYFDRAAKMTLTEQALEAVNEAKLQIDPKARRDFLSRVFADFKVDGELQTVPADGVFDADGKPAKLDKSWAMRLIDDAPHLFVGSSGGGAGGGDRAKVTTTKRIDGADKNAFLSNLDGIAKGTVEVRR